MANQINLLPQNKKKLSDKFFYFILHYFRYIIVITQIFVISVFFYRFYIDNKILKLKEKYKQNQQILTITYGIVEEAQALEDKSNKVRLILDEQEKFHQLYNFTTNSIPPQITINALSFENNVVSLEAISETSKAIITFKEKLQASDKFEQVSITKLDRNIDNFYIFAISAKIKNG